MGNLHAGHLSLVQRLKARVDKLVVSIFVNPKQFAADEDLASYPRTLEADCEVLRDCGVDIVFNPTVDEMYTTDPKTQITLPALSQDLCGASRPSHFAGVALVVTKLFNIVQPKVAIFGEKDYQQLMMIRSLVADLNLPLEVEAAPIVRDTDGLALSSRNQYLSWQERRIAPSLYATLQAMCVPMQQVHCDRAHLLVKAGSELEAQGFAVEAQGFAVDYLTIRRQEDLQPLSKDDDAFIILAAVFLGKTRLIDNLKSQVVV